MVGDKNMIRSVRSGAGGGDEEFVELPPITLEERCADLSLLQRHLNGQMKCMAGSNRIDQQSLTVGGVQTPSRITLKCRLRAEYGLNQDVYLDFIRAVCCGQPKHCLAVQSFLAERDGSTGRCPTMVK